MLTSVEHAMETPWKIWNRWISWMSYPWVRMQFAMNRIPWGRGWSFYGPPIIQKHRNSVMKFGDGLQLRSTVRSTPLGPYHPVILCTLNEKAEIEVGVNFRMNGGTIVTAERITIGDNVTIGSNTTIVDTDFHPSDPLLRRQAPNQGVSSPTIIESNVFIGANCYILRGVTIGQGSVVGICSVVTLNVQPGTVVFGNPARLIGKVGG